VPAFRERIERLRFVFPEVAVFDAACASQTGVVRAFLATLRPNAQPIGPYDALLAGQAIALGAVFITDNLGEFGRVPGLRCASWRV
jgi:tRNA(fMet)-specific endonuclease VapC